MHEKASELHSMQLDERPAKLRTCHCNMRVVGCGLVCAALTATSVICLLTAQRTGMLCRSGALCSWAPALRSAAMHSNSSLAQHSSSTADPEALTQALAAHSAADMWCTGQGMLGYAKACLVKDLYYDRTARKFLFFGKTIRTNESDTAQTATAEQFELQTCASLAVLWFQGACAPRPPGCYTHFLSLSGCALCLPDLGQGRFAVSPASKDTAHMRASACLPV